jgi:hypothetical protein
MAILRSVTNAAIADTSDLDLLVKRRIDSEVSTRPRSKRNTHRPLDNESRDVAPPPSEPAGMPSLCRILGCKHHIASPPS